MNEQNQPQVPPSSRQIKAMSAREVYDYMEARYAREASGVVKLSDSIIASTGVTGRQRQAEIEETLMRYTLNLLVTNPAK